MNIFLVDERAMMISEIKNKYNLSSSRVFKAMTQVPREEFTPEKYKELAYKDNPIPIGYSQTMSQPYTVAFMTHLLLQGTKPCNKVLEIGTGSGYQSAILSKLVKQVYTVEIIPELAERAKRILRKLGYKNVTVKSGSGELGWKEKAPYDAIIITAAVKTKVSQELFNQLKVNGVLVAPIGERDVQTMTRFMKKSASEIKKGEFEKFIFVPFVEN